MPMADMFVIGVFATSFVLCWSGFTLISLSLSIQLVRTLAQWRSQFPPDTKQMPMQDPRLPDARLIPAKSQLFRWGTALGGSGLATGALTGLLWVTLRLP